MVEDTVKNTLSRRFSCHGVLVALAATSALALAGCSGAKASGGGDGGPEGGSSGWQTVGGDKVAAGSADKGRIVAASGTPYAAYVDTMTSKLTVVKSTGTGWTPVGASGVTADSISYNGYTIAVDGTTPYVAYVTSGTSAITVVKFDGSTWVPVGKAGIGTAGYYGAPTLFIANGKPYVIFTDSSSAPHIMAYGGTTWTDLAVTATPGGDAGTGLPSYVNYLVSGIGSDGTLWIAFNDTSRSLLVLMKYDGTKWIEVATTTVMIDEDWAPNLTVSNGTVFLTYLNSTSGAVVMKLVGTQLQSVGTLGSISNGDDIEYVTGAVYNGVPYVAFDDEAHDYDPAYPNPMAATVKTFDGSQWVLYAGYPNPCDIEYTYLYADQSNGKVYLTYSDCQSDMTVQVSGR
jgi:hypothetical protein